ncbi:hypothetical protein ACFPRL_22200 [Pseudoclavibacter helvolus]
MGAGDRRDLRRAAPDRVAEQGNRADSTRDEQQGDEERDLLGARAGLHEDLALRDELDALRGAEAELPLAGRRTC